MSTSGNCAVSRAVQDFVHQPTQTHNASCLAMSSKHPIIVIIIVIIITTATITIIITIAQFKKGVPTASREVGSVAAPVPIIVARGAPLRPQRG